MEERKQTSEPIRGSSFSLFLPHFAPSTHRPGGLALSGGGAFRELAAGQRVFNPYELIDILGQGSLGVVWLAKDMELTRDVEPKFLRHTTFTVEHLRPRSCSPNTGLGALTSAAPLLRM